MQQLTHEIYLARRKQKNINHLAHEAALLFPPISRLQQIRQEQSRLSQQLAARRKIIELGGYQPSRRYNVMSEQKRIKQLSQGNSFIDRHHFNQDIFIRKYQSTEKGKERLKAGGMPMKTSRKSRGSILKLFHKLYYPVVFIIKLKRELQASTEAKRQFTISKQMSLRKQLKQFVKITLQAPYKSDLNEYLRILDLQAGADQQNKTTLDRDALSMLQCLTGKLKRDAMQMPPSFITQLSLLIDEHSFVTVPLLFMPQAKRLSIHPVDHSLYDIGIEQSQMLIACLLGIKCLVWDILMKPYISQPQSNQEYQYALKYNKQLCKIASIVYYIIMEQFVWELQYVQDQHKDTNQSISIPIQPLLQKPPIKPPPTQQNVKKKPLDSSQSQHSSEQQQDKSYIKSEGSGQDELIVGQTMNHYNKMNMNYRQEMQRIRLNVTSWIKQITITILKRNRRNKVKHNRKKKISGLSSHP